MLQLRVALTAFLVGLFMVLNPSSAFAEVVFVNVVCADNRGEQQSFAIGWDNTNTFFDGKGDIARFFCEGGHARQYNVYVSDDLAVDDVRRYYNGIVPTPTVSPEPMPEPVVPTPVVTETPQPEPSPVQSESPTPTQTLTPESTPSSSPTPVAEPPVVPSVKPTVEVVAPIEATPQATVQPEPSPTLVALPEPSIEPAPIVEPVTEQIVSLQVPDLFADIEAVAVLFEAAEAFMNIGSDMTPEQREESQKVVVSAIIVTQLAMPRRMK